MKDAVAIAYARAYGDFEGILAKYRISTSDEDRVRLLVALMSLEDPSLVALSLGLGLGGEVKRQDVRNMISAAGESSLRSPLSGVVNPRARGVAWIWLKTNIEKLRKLYEGTGALSGDLLRVIPIIGIGRVKEVDKFFQENAITEAESGIKAGLEKLKVYDRLASS